ncbi:MAG: 2OG-Fe(II) oxygenase [Paracoccaceae bacterium]|nr:2OG-Fe(II) oxygenase [Paracoccaceae bacterium]
MTVLDAPSEALAAGDRAPNFVLPDHNGKFTMFYDRVEGRPVVLLLTGPFQPPILPAALVAFQSAAEKFAAAGIDVFCIAQAPQEVVKALSTKLHVWADAERKISAAYLTQTGLGADILSGGQAVALLLDPNQRLLAAMTGDSGALADEVLAFYAARPPRPAPESRNTTAPVLTMPNLLDPAMCKALMGLFEAGDVQEGTVGSVLAGQEMQRVHHIIKKRLDLKIEDPEMHKTLSTVIGRRVAPEMAKAFDFQGFVFDRFLICRYAADREDRFRTHRDNISPETADRRFAMTLNLNGDEYEGGELVFPEYGPHGYKPGNGGAVIFSCSLLHEALPVTKGVRFALLTFMRQPKGQQGG